MKYLLILGLLGLGAAVLNAGQNTPTDTPTDSLRNERKESMLQNSGGIVEKPGKGKILIINGQDRVDTDLIKEKVNKVAYVLKVPIETTRGRWQLEQKKPEDATIAIYLVDDETLPISLVAVEEGWAVINTKTLTLGSRFSKELTRIICLAAGAACSPIKTSPMQPVHKSADLDTLKTDGFTMDMYTAIMTNLKALGMEQTRKTSYLKACKEGWAPTPTNEVQKAVWNRVRAEKERGPSNPMLIKP